MIRPTAFGLLLTLFLPSAIYVAFSAASMSAGLLLCAMFWLLLDLFSRARPLMLQQTDLRQLAILGVAIILLFIHVVIANFQLGGVDFTRFFASCALLLLVFAGAQAASGRLMRAPTSELIRAADIALVILTMIAIAAALGAPSVGPQSTAKAVVIFSEPSHFAFAFMPMLLFRAALSRRFSQLLLLGIAFLTAVLLQSLTMIAGVIIVAALLLRQATLVVMMLAVAAGLFAFDVTYYADRLNFSSETENISALVFLQGWQNAILDFQATYGFGVGYQQFGIVGSLGDIAEKIAALEGDYIDLFDGGSTATKLVAEFGVLGVLATICFIVAAYRYAAFIRRTQKKPRNQRNVRKTFFFALVVTYSFELFIRGAGYFTPGGFLMLTALISIHNGKPSEASNKIAAREAAA